MTRFEAAELLERLAIGSEEPYRSREVRRILDDKDHAREVLRHTQVRPHNAAEVQAIIDTLGLRP